MMTAREWYAAQPKPYVTSGITLAEDYGRYVEAELRAVPKGAENICAICYHEFSEGGGRAALAQPTPKGEPTVSVTYSQPELQTGGGEVKTFSIPASNAPKGEPHVQVCSCEVLNVTQAMTSIKDCPVHGEQASDFARWWHAVGIHAMPRHDQPPEHAAIARLAWNAALAERRAPTPKATDAPLREQVAELHSRAREKAQRYVRSSRLFPEYHAAEVAYKTVLKLMDSASNEDELRAGAAASPRGERLRDQEGK